MKTLATPYLVLLIILGSITITTVIADTVTINTYPYTFQDNSANQRFVIASSGIGIGTTNPVGLLNIAPSGNYAGRQLALQNWADLSSVGGGEGLFASNAYLNNTDNTVRFSNTHSTIGSTGFAVNYPTWNSASIFVNNGPSTAGQKVTPNLVATFTPTGVGIGTTNPAQPLDVNGNIRLTGNIVSPNDICIGNC